MVVLDIQNLRKSYGGQVVLDGLGLRVEEGEHTALLGENGAGKTTLLKIILGAETPDEAAGHDFSISVPRNTRIGHLSQLPVYAPGTTALDILRMSRSALEGADAFTDTLETDIRKIAEGLSLTPLLNRPAEKLSGGERTRVCLARLLLERHDFLLLDEPTNHLDLRACRWLEEFLDKFRGTVLAVSHDRYFVDKFAKRCVEIHDGIAESYPGNYSFYAKEREFRFAERMRRYEKERDEYERVASAALQMREWAGKNKFLHRRAANMEKRAERIKVTEKPRVRRGMKNAFSEADFRADDALILRGVSKRFGERGILKDINLVVRGGERVALLGDNGAGKTTLLNAILGNPAPDGGTVKTGPAVKLGYLPQNVSFPNPERSLLDTLLYEIPGISSAEARNRLGAFMFKGEKVFDPVSALSGGELSRLKLCILMSSRVNLLLLDEPTNHLDIDARSWVEDALGDYDGGLLFVSHDRYFIEQFATRVWWLEDGAVTDFEGTFGQFQRQLAGKVKDEVKPRERERREKTGNLSPAALARERERVSRRLEKAIAACEERLAWIDAKIAEHASDFERLGELLDEREVKESERDGLYMELGEIL